MKDYKVPFTFGIKVYDTKKLIRLPERMFLSLPVAEFRKISKSAAKFARKFNFKFRNQIDWDADKK